MDKEIALLLSEMLIKQDENTAQIKDVSDQVKETNAILADFMSVSVEQWKQQQAFNEIFVGELKGIKKELVSLTQLEARLKAVEERENDLDSRLTKVEKLLKAS